MRPEGSIQSAPLRFRKANMRHLACTTALGVALCACSAHAQTFKTLVQFTGTGGTASGDNPLRSLIASGSTLYGMTSQGGASGNGNVFSVDMNGTNYRNLASFTGSGGTASGQYPYGDLIAVGGMLYGTTELGGAGGYGNLFSVGMNGTNYQNLLSFTGSGGAASGKYPTGNLIASGSTFYGMTQQGGTGGYGNLFSVGVNGANYQNLLSFTGSGGAASGQYPLRSLIASGSTLYGMTFQGGGFGNGNIFRVATDGTNYQNLVSFTGTTGTANGRSPEGSLILSGTTLYGMTRDGGYGSGNIFSVATDGTNYQNLVSFTYTGGTASGNAPYGSLILNGTSLYGMTFGGGVHGFGNIFSVGIDGSGYEDLYDFTAGEDCGFPQGDLLASGGTLFGMASQGGPIGHGTVFALTLPTPEPGTLALVVAGAAALVSYRWRRRRRRQ